jgi:D-alanyl-D-alanine carboxypeptidase
MALILDWIRQNDQKIIGITELKSETVSGHTWVNPAHFLSWSNYEGGKNGYTEEADRTSAGLFELGAAKHLYAVIVLGSEDRDGDVIKLLSLVK